MSSSVYTFADLNNLFIKKIEDSSSFDEEYYVCCDYRPNHWDKLLLISPSEKGTAVVPIRSDNQGLSTYLSHLLFDVALDKETLEKCPLSNYAHEKFIISRYCDNDIDLSAIRDYLDRAGFGGKHHWDWFVDKHGTRHVAVILDVVLDQEQTKELAEIFTNGVNDLGSFTEYWLDFFKWCIDTGKYERDMNRFCNDNKKQENYFKPTYWKMLQAKKKAIDSVSKKPYKYSRILDDDESFETDGDAAITLKLPESSKLAGKYLCYAVACSQGDSVAVGGIFDEVPEYINTLEESDPGIDNAIVSFETAAVPTEPIFFEYLPNEETFIDYFFEGENHGMIYFGDKQEAYTYWSEKLQDREDW